MSGIVTIGVRRAMTVNLPSAFLLQKCELPKLMTWENIENSQESWSNYWQEHGIHVAKAPCLKIYQNSSICSFEAAIKHENAKFMSVSWV